MAIVTDKKVVDQLLSRRVTDVIVQAHLRKKLLSGKKLVCKFGIDPTGSQLHIGHMVVVRKLAEFQRAGHEIVIIVGDYTARIGDPSGRDKMREPLTEEQVEANMRDYRKQLCKVLDERRTKFEYQSQWFGKFGLDRILELAGLFSVQQMLERDMFQERVKTERPIGVHEFLYPLLQGYDSVAVKADVEFGGTDQTFNLLVGRSIQEHFGQEAQDVVTLPLLEGLDGRKMSKSYGNFVAVLDTPSDMFGKIMSLADALIIRYFTLMTDVVDEEIRELGRAMAGGENPRNVKARLAREIVTLYHGAAVAAEAEAAFDRVFRDKGAPADMPKFVLKKNPALWVDVLYEAQLAASRSDARRMLSQGAVKLNKKQVVSWDAPYKFLEEDVIQVGKRKFIQVGL